MSCEGRIVIGDFNVACIVTPGTPVTSKAGTRSYMGNINSVTIILFCYVISFLAPEVFSPPQEGYTYAVDWWSLGVTAYKLLRAQVYYSIKMFAVICFPVGSVPNWFC